MEFGEKIAVLRKERGMTQAELGSELNVTFQAVSKWERGESFPDFATMSRLAKLFGVPLTYFEDEEVKRDDAPVDEAKEVGATAVAANGEKQTSEKQENPPEKMVGVCKTCGMVVYSGQEGRLQPALVCKKCCEREMAAEIRRRKEAERKIAEEKKRAENMRQAAIAAKRSKRNKGLVIGGLIAALILIIAIVSGATSKEDTGAIIGGGIAMTVFTFTFVSQLVWGGAVRSVCLTGGAIIGTPGVIFTLDTDGIIFLITMRIFFALLKLFIFFVTTMFFVVIAYIISPFTFIPRLATMSSATPLED